MFFVLRSSNKVVASGNLVAWWKFDESSGDAADSSGSGFTLTNHNVTYTTGQVDNAASFDGSTSYFSGTAPALANNSFTISVWIYADSVPHDMDYVSIGDNQSTNQQLHLRVYASGVMRLGFFNDDLDTPGGTFTTGFWHNVLFTYDATTNARIVYLDGVQKASDTASGDFQGNTVINVGRRAGSGDEYWLGKVDDLKIYNRVLTSDEITDLSEGQGGPDVPTPTPTPTNTPTPTPTPTVTPTPTITPTPTPASSGSGGSSGGGSSSCTAVTERPNLYEIDPLDTAVTVYFTPVSNADTYVLSYGITIDANQYAISFSNSDHSGAVKYTINSLNKNTKYYLKVRGGNGCSSGSWSSIKSSTTSSENSGTFVSQITNSLPEAFAPKKKLNIVSSKLSETTPAPSANSKTTTQSQSGINLDVKVLGTDNQPQIGVVVTLHSKIQTAKTDKKGIAHFSNVEKGEHKVLLAYNDYTGEQQLNVNGSQKNQTLTVQVKLTSGLSWGWVAILIVIFLVVTLFLLFLLFKRRKKKKGNE